MSRGHSGVLNEKDVISREVHELETEKLELEIQQCKEMIKTQQQLLQVVGFIFSFFLIESKCILFNVPLLPLSLFPFLHHTFKIKRLSGLSNCASGLVNNLRTFYSW